MFFRKSKKQKNDARDRDRLNQSKVLEGQRTLLEAATATADIAHLVTARLKQRLDDSVKQFETTARILNDALLVCSNEGEIQAFNPAAERMFGRESKDARELPAWQLFIREDGSPIDAADTLWRLLEEETTVYGIRANGSQFVLDHSFARLDRSNGTVSVLLLLRECASAAITDHRCSIFETSFDGILIQQDGLIVATNPAVTRLFGYKAADILGKPVTALLDINEPTSAEGWHQDGKTLDLLYTTAPITWNDHPGRLVVIKDVTAMRRLEEKVALKRDNGVDMICCYDSDYRITFVNESFAKSVKRTREDLIGSGMLDILRADERDPFLLNIGRLTPEHPTRRMQIQIDQGGDTRVYDWIDHVSYDSRGAPIEFQRIGRDISNVVSELITSRPHL